MINVFISFSVASLALEQPYDCPSASEANPGGYSVWVKLTGTKPQQNTRTFGLTVFFLTVYMRSFTVHNSWVRTVGCVHYGSVEKSAVQHLVVAGCGAT